MRTKLFYTLMIMGLMLNITFLGLAIQQANAESKGFSIVSFDPDTVAALKAQGKAINYPYPESANKGKKFNPTGTLVGPLTTEEEQYIIVIFVEFATAPPGSTDTRLDLGYFDDMLFGTFYDPPEYPDDDSHPTDRTLANYWTEVSYGQVTIGTHNLPSVQGWIQLTNTYDYYCKADGVHDNGFGPYPNNVQGIVNDAVLAADPYIDFSQYAVSGVVPNLFVVVAGTGAEWSGDPSIIWSHSWDVSEGSGLDMITVDGVKVNNYAMMPEVGGDLTGYANSGVPLGPYPPTCGVYAHEYGHVLGLPDEYDYGYESEGTGMYSLMSAGSWARYPYETLDQRRLYSGNSPTHIDAWGKYRLGFLTPTLVTNTIAVSMENVEEHPVVYKMVVPNSDGKEYFLLENRQNIGFDISLARYGAPYGAHGLAVYHVDDNVLTRNYWRSSEAENWKEFRSEGWRKAWTGDRHYAISLIQADDQWHLEHAANVADSGDLYPGSSGVTSLTSFTKPNTSNYYFWAGSAPKFGYSGVTITNIAEAGGIISASLSFVPWVAPKK